jgi:hypothetical protein
LAGAGWIGLDGRIPAFPGFNIPLSAKKSSAPAFLWASRHCARLDFTRFIGSNIDMEPEIFQASRWTRGNMLFPTYIEVTDKSVSRRKRSWFRLDEMSMSLSKVASVHIKTGLVWSEILIESSGGSDPIASHGHSKDDARRIKELIENAQAELAKRPEGAA